MRPGPAARPWWTVPLTGLHDALALPSAPGPSDAIFVFAGSGDRKRYGLALWREGVAPVLVVSVGRFEWRRLAETGLPEDGGLRALVEQTPPARRHFFLTLEGSIARADWVPRRRFGTQSEARALVLAAKRKGWRSVLAVTTAAHSRRAALALRRALGPDPGIALAFALVPEPMARVRRDAWWGDGRGRSLVVGEWLKLPIYWLLARR